MKTLAKIAYVCAGLLIVGASVASAIPPLVMFGIIAAGTPPPPYTSTQVNLATVNALGGVGRSQGWTITNTSSSVAIDVLADAHLPADVKAEIESPAVSTVMRFVTIKRIPNPSITDTDHAVCARLGPDTNSPALACDGTDDSDQSNGGCYLTADGEFCQWTLRPIISGCTNYAQCHQPVWFLGSNANTQIQVKVDW